MKPKKGAEVGQVSYETVVLIFSISCGSDTIGTVKELDKGVIRLGNLTERQRLIDQQNLLSSVKESERRFPRSSCVACVASVGGGTLDCVACVANQGSSGKHLWALGHTSGFPRFG